MNRLTEIRKKKNIPITEIAYKCGVTSATVYNWEKRTRCPAANNVKPLAKALGVSVNEILDIFSDER